MSDVFRRLYDARPFDPDDRQDKIGEAARQLLLDAALPVTAMVKDGRDMPYLLGGLLVGIVQVMQATARGGAMPADEVDAAIRASIVQTAAWSVDMARSSEGKGPLPSA